jgi:hypothetical protein
VALYFPKTFGIQWYGAYAAQVVLVLQLYKVSFLP